MIPSPARSYRSLAVAFVTILTASVLLAGWIGEQLRQEDERRSRAQSYQVGVSPGHHVLDLDEPSLSRLLDAMRDMGLSWLRLDLDWSEIEAVQGAPDWSDEDRIIQAARARGLRVLAILTYCPTWANGGAGSKTPPTDPADFARFAALAAERYSPMGVGSWEVWNEANLTDFWAPFPDPARYTQLLTAASSAIHAVAPQAQILTSGMAGVSRTKIHGNIAAIDFLEALYANGAASSFDGVAAHPYTFPALASETQSWNAFNRMRELRAVMVKRGDGRKPIWITETGAPTGTGERAVTESRQAEILVDAITTARSLPWVGPVMLYSGVDSGNDSQNWEENFGFLRADFQPKLSYHAIINVLQNGDG